MSSSSTVIAVLDRLDGPTLTHQDLEWVNDIPAGKKLLDYLASQVQFAEGEAFALRDIALEKEEVQLWEKAVEAGLATLSPVEAPSCPTELTQIPSDYTTPSSVRSLLGYIKEEQVLLDNHLKLLNQRIAQAREVVREAARARKTLHTIQDQTSQSVSRLSEYLTELSFMTDATLNTAVRCACKLVKSLSVSEKNDAYTIYQCLDELPNLLDAFSSLQSDLNQLSSSHFKQTGSHDPLADHRIDGLRLEVQRLTAAIEEFENQHVIDELEKMCHSLHEGTSLEKLLTPDESTFISHCTENQRWSQVAIENAWNIEQAGAMQHRTEDLKEFAEILRDDILPPLALISASVNLMDEAGKKVQVAIQALRDELADIEPHRRPMDAESNGRCGTRFQNDTIELETLAKRLLKRLRNFGPETCPPFTLLERQDVLSELSSLHNGYDTAYAEASKAWCSASSTPSTSSQDYLSSLMAHSPMNTDLPVSLPASVYQKVSEVSVEVAEISRKLRIIPKDITKDSHTRRRLDKFIRMTILS